MTGRVMLRGSALVMGVALALAGASGCSGQPVQPPGPEDPYGHPRTLEDSVAVPVSTGGQVDLMAAGLRAAGFFCAQVRASATARQVWCRTVEQELTVRDGPSVSTVDVVTTPAGQVEYLRVNLPDPPVDLTSQMLGGGWDADTRLAEILSASLLRVWPDDTADVRAVIAEVRDYGFGPGQSQHDPRTPRRATAHTEHADYFVGEGTFFAQGAKTSGAQPLSFVAATDQLSDSWPSSSAHSLATPVVAAPGLEAGGFDCYGDIKMPCVRVAGNQTVEYSTARGVDDVVKVSVFIGGGPNEDGGFSTLADRGFPHGLTFLTDAVRLGVETRLNQARHDGASFTGIVDGAVVVIDASPPPRPRNHSDAVPVTLTVGAPLVTGTFGT